MLYIKVLRVTGKKLYKAWIMNLLFFFCVVLRWVGSSYAERFKIENEALRLEFEDGIMVSLFDKALNSEKVNEDTAQPLWEIIMVNDEGSIQIDSVNSRIAAVQGKVGSSRANMLTLLWSGVELRDDQSSSTWVSLEVLLNGDLSEWVLKTGLDKCKEDARLGLWSAKINVAVSTGASSSGQLFFPYGLGNLYTNPALYAAEHNNEIMSTYPSGGASMQFMAVVDENEGGSSGVYVGSHDGQGYIKDLSYSVSHDPNSRASSVLSIIAYPENTGLPLATGQTWTMPYAVSVGLVEGVSTSTGRPLHVEAAMIYKKAMLPISGRDGRPNGSGANWVKHRSIPTKGASGRRYPHWYRSNAVWINTHWQCHDVFNATGGDPSYVSTAAAQIADLLGQPSLAMHWYEWQQGPKPGEDNRYKFDTHYPDYYPARQDYEEVQEQLERSGIKTFPYINGRIFDINSDSFLSENGAAYCTKELIQPRLLSEEVHWHGNEHDSNLQIVTESYGSNATFCVANPYTSYWQSKIADLTERLVNGGAMGVYIDQVGAAPPRQCWEASHNHSLGGGTYWVHGYERMLQQVDTLVGNDPSANNNNNGLGGKVKSPIVTEDCAEVYMDRLHGYLVLGTYKNNLGSPTSSVLTEGSVNTLGDKGMVNKEARSHRGIAPAFAVVYGGYYTAFGAEWFLTDFNDHNWWRGKLAAQFHAGIQMGWFSIAGMAAGTDPDEDSNCGAMGVGEALLDVQHAPLVEFLKTCAAYRRSSDVLDYLSDGYMIRPAVLDPVPNRHQQNMRASKANVMPADLLDYDSVSLSAWQVRVDSNDSGEDVTTAVMLSNNMGSGAYKGKMRVDFQAWGYESAHLQMYRLEPGEIGRTGEEGPTARHRMDTLTGPVAYVDVRIEPTQVLIFEFVA